MPVAEGYLAGAALQFLLGEGDLLDTFAVGAVECGVSAKSEIEPAIVELTLEPKQPVSYERLGLRVNALSGEVSATPTESREDSAASCESPNGHLACVGRR